EDGIRDLTVTGVQTCALPISETARKLGQFFGAKKLPELARGLGQAIKEFQKAKDEFTDELHKAGPSDTTKPAPPASTVARTDAQIGRASCRERGAMRDGPERW